MSIANDSEMLAYILDKFEQLDPVLLQQIQYYDEEESSRKEKKEDVASISKINFKACRRILLCKPCKKRRRKRSHSAANRAVEEVKKTMRKKITPLHLAFRNHE